LVIASTLLGVLAALGASLMVTPQYQSQTTVFLSAANAQNDVGTAYSGTLFTQQLAKSQLDEVTGHSVTAGVASDVGGGLTSTEVAGKLSATNPLDTSLITITATDPDPVRAQQIAASAAKHFGEVAIGFTSPSRPTSATDGTTPITPAAVISVNTVQPASLPTSPSTPRLTLNLALGFLVGLVVGIGLMLLSGLRRRGSGGGAGAGVSPQPA
jgi:capsular polysaccharide biosynthesis protein